MKKLGLNEIREKFLAFFESKEHLRINSYPLVPHNDKSLLLINSGMAPMKAFFTGAEIPPSKRVTTCQKCIRTGDIENVGITARHGTFFEMLGDFSFGDYFKEEIIPWSWEFLTKDLEIPEERLYISVYLEDDEALEIWNKKVGIPREKIFKMGKEDNFWEVGLGPCGPCSEIYYDKGEEFGCGEEGCTVGCDCDRYMEIWNLVFTQFEKQEDDSYKKLEFPNIDTGMGLERISTVMQNVNSIFDIDTIKEIRDKVCEIANVTYGNDSNLDVSIRIITDHIRSVTFMTSDGVLPSNEGRGYVLRRLLRRAIMHGKLMGVSKQFLSEIATVVIKNSCEAYPELLEKKDYILKVLSVEEKRFYDTLDQGIELVRGHIKNLKSLGIKIPPVLPGSEAFRLYDTFGFPIEMLKEMLDKEGIKVDEVGFKTEMQAQKERARSAREESTYMGSDQTVYDNIDPNISTEFLGYANKNCDAKILYIVNENNLVDSGKEGDKVSVILDKTVFYAESGGQKGDIGLITNNNCNIKITDCVKVGKNKFAHIGVITSGLIKISDTVNVAYDEKNRLSTGRNHTAAHLLHSALRQVLGNHVEQAGSSVSADRMRFDFTHFSGLTYAEVNEVASIVNSKILEAINISTTEKTIEEAKKMGAMALFGEKYGSTVRVVDVENFSIELCGGTHVNNTSILGIFKIVSETGVAAGVRRIEALTGEGAYNYYFDIDKKINFIQNAVKATNENVTKKVESFIEQAKSFNKEMDKLRSRQSGDMVEDLIKSKEIINGHNFIATKIDGADINTLKQIGDKIKEKLDNSAIVLISEKDNKVEIVTMVSDNLVKLGANAGNIIKEISALVDGKGGGRPNMAQGGGNDPTKIVEALKKATSVFSDQIKK